MLTAAVVLSVAAIASVRAQDAAISIAALPAQNPLRCSADSDDGRVLSLTDGTYKRCAAVVTPKEAPTPMPVLFWFHGSSGDAAHCENHEMASRARMHGFALVCAEGLQDIFGHGGRWSIPEVQTNETGTKCGEDDSVDIQYIKGVIGILEAADGIYDTSRIFTSGCSMGSGFSTYIASCMKETMPSAISAFATHSTGLKVKGDGNNWPKEMYRPEYEWAECPECQYFPIVPQTSYSDDLGLKACIFDNTGDPSVADPSFYRSSLALSLRWRQLGNREEHHYRPGAHCQFIPFDDIVACLDDGTGRLLRPAELLV